MTCAKCGSDDVRAVSVGWGKIGSSIPIGSWSSVNLIHHICTNCGFVEAYVADPEARKKIAAKWPVAKP